MPFLLLDAEPAPDAVRRLAREQIDAALAALGETGDPDAGVHAARKSCKRLRALLRLARGDLESVRKREDTTVRDAARQLAGARDHAVLCDAFDKLAAGANDSSAFAAVRSHLPGRQGVGAGAEAVGGAMTGLSEVRARSEQWPLETLGWPAYEPGLRRIYSRGADAAARAEAEPTTEHLHEWRKSVKHLWHSLEVLSAIWPQVLGPLAEEVHELSDALGDDHDLALLVPVLEEQTPPPRQLLDLALRRREALQRRARTLGRRVYADRPKAFTRRMGALYAAWDLDGDT